MLCASTRPATRRTATARSLRMAATALPLAWTELLGNVFHPWCCNWPTVMLHDDIAPAFTNLPLRTAMLLTTMPRLDLVKLLPKGGAAGLAWPRTALPGILRTVAPGATT